MGRWGENGDNDSHPLIPRDLDFNSPNLPYKNYVN